MRVQIPSPLINKIKKGVNKMDYVKPMVLEVEDIAEGIYAASGEVGEENNDREDQCWTVTIDRDQVIATKELLSFV